MPNQSAPGTMFDARRKHLQDLQDQFLNHPKIQSYVSVYGETWCIFMLDEKSRADNLRHFVEPELEGRISEWLSKNPLKGEKSNG